ncbi:hypothetical protein SynBMKMC1_01976 [Synechococcus sp. BMK-MC-1]|nr:hypothetical protein SynBMKMC1_01976 [Synechococcus sp. BMK-MC-1]
MQGIKVVGTQGQHQLNELAPASMVWSSLVSEKESKPSREIILLLSTCSTWGVGVSHWLKTEWSQGDSNS